MMGSRRDMDSSAPFTELIMGTPLYRRMAAWMASGLDESSCSGRSHTSCTLRTAWHKSAFSSEFGTPQFRSRKSAPASFWASASCCRYSKLPSASAALSFFLPVGLSRSPQMRPFSRRSIMVDEQIYVPSGLDISGAGWPL